MSSVKTLPHGYAVEILVNAGSFRSYWKIDEESPVRDELHKARADRDEAVAAGYSPDHLRIVALTVVD